MHVSPPPTRGRLAIALALALSPFAALAPACDSGSGPEGSTWVPPTPTDEDPCAGVPVVGECRGASIAYCVVGTGSSEPFTWDYPCGLGQTCSPSAYGPVCVHERVPDGRDRVPRLDPRDLFERRLDDHDLRWRLPRFGSQ